jgi:glutamate dehydrogenase
MAYAKMEIYEALTSSEMPLEKELTATYLEYVPKTLKSHFGENANDHPLKKEIVSTVLTNNITNQAGSTFVSRMAQVTERSIPDIIRTYLILESSLGATEIRERLYSMTDISEKERYEVLIDLEDVLKMLVRNVLQSQAVPPGFEQIDQYHGLLSELVEHPDNSVDTLNSENDQSPPDSEWEKVQSEDLSEQRAIDAVRTSLRRLRLAPDVIHLCINKKLGVSTAYRIAESVEQKFGLDWLRERLILQEPGNDWELEFQDILLRTLDANKLRLLEVLLASHKIETMKEQDFSTLLEPLEEMNAAHLRAYIQSLEQLKSGSLISLTSIAVNLSHLDFLKNISSKI